MREEGEFIKISNSVIASQHHLHILRVRSGLLRSLTLSRRKVQEILIHDIRS